MSYWSHNPELLDEIISNELHYRAQSAPGECIICFGPSKYYDEDWYWIEKKFGSAFADSIAIEAERNYWDGLCP